LALYDARNRGETRGIVVRALLDFAPETLAWAREPGVRSFQTYAARRRQFNTVNCSARRMGVANIIDGKFADSDQNFEVLAITPIN
jgi:hypothetical protein